MHIKKCILKVYGKNKKSITVLLSKDKKMSKDNKETRPSLMMVVSNNNLKEVGLNPKKIKKDSYIFADVTMRKDNDFNLWLYIDTIYQKEEEKKKTKTKNKKQPKEVVVDDVDEDEIPF